MELKRVTIVGRPNVGKSSLLNRLAGRRVSIVEPTAGVTRDRVSVTLEWRGHHLELIDTGGLGLVDDHLLKEHIEAQIQVALEVSDLILFVVDAKDGLVPGDEMVAQRLRRLSDRVVPVVNKVESRWEENSVSDWFKLGFGDPLAVSANEGFGCSDLLDRVVEELPALQAKKRREKNAEKEAEEESDILKFAVVGKRNSGKSTFINQLVGEDRVIVSEVPGTTRDAVDVTFEFGGRQMMAIDTAGIRRKSSLADAIEFFSHSRSMEGIRRADIVIHMFDITSTISQVDQKVAAYCVEHHKPVLLVGNKLDLAGDDMSLEKWDSYIKQQLSGLSFAPVSFISAIDAVNMDDTLELLFELRKQARTKLPTAKLNEHLTLAKQKLQPRSKSVIPKLFYATQIRTEPVTIILFVNEPKLFRGQYERYLQNYLRKAFELPEVPLRLLFRRRQKVLLQPE